MRGLAEPATEPPTAAQPARPTPRAANSSPATWSRFRYPQSLYKYAALLASLAACRSAHPTGTGSGQPAPAEVMRKVIEARL